MSLGSNIDVASLSELTSAEKNQDINIALLS